MGYLCCPICEKTELSDVQELQQKLAAALCKCHLCPICSAEVQGLHAMHLHLATHIPIKGFLASPLPYTPGSPDQFPSLEKLDIQDDRNSPIVQDCYNVLQHRSTLTSSIGGSMSRDASEGAQKGMSSTPVQYNCDICGLVFWSEHFLTLHKDMLHANAISFEVTCKQCKSRFKDLEAYRDHVKEEHSDRRYICEHCPKSFKVKGGLLVHTRMYHDQSSPSSCATCRRNFTSKARKELHEKRYHSTTKTQLKNDRTTSLSTDGINSIGDAKTCLDDLLNATTSSIENIPLVGDDNRVVQRFSTHQKLGRLASSPPVLVQSSFTSSRVHNAATNNNVIASDTSTILPLDVEMKDQNTSPRADQKKEESRFQELPNQESESVTSNLNESQNFKFYENLKPFLNLNDTQLDSLHNSSSTSFAVQCLPYLLNYNKEIWENNVAQDPLNSRDVAIDLLKNLNFPEQRVDNPKLPNIIERNSIEDSTPKSLSVDESGENMAPQTDNQREELVEELQLSNTTESQLKENECSSSFEENNLSFPQTLLQNSNSFSKKNNFLNRGLDNKQWECDVCKKSFTTKYFLKKHKRLHTGETPYCCIECGKNFTFQQSYHKHVFYHSDDKPHVCPHCGRAFKEMSTLHNHIRIHTGEKPFTCATCGKAFRQRVSYLVHQRIHTGQMPYHCDICNRSFRYKVSLRSHKCDGVQKDEVFNANLDGVMTTSGEQELQGFTPDPSTDDGSPYTVKTPLSVSVNSKMSALNAETQDESTSISVAMSGKSLDILQCFNQVMPSSASINILHSVAEHQNTREVDEPYNSTAAFVQLSHLLNSSTAGQPQDICQSGKKNMKDKDSSSHMFKCSVEGKVLSEMGHDFKGVSCPTGNNVELSISHNEEGINEPTQSFPETIHGSKNATDHFLDAGYLDSRPTKIQTTLESAPSIESISNSWFQMKNSSKLSSLTNSKQNICKTKSLSGYQMKLEENWSERLEKSVNCENNSSLFIPTELTEFIPVNPPIDDVDHETFLKSLFS